MVVDIPNSSTEKVETRGSGTCLSVNLEEFVSSQSEGQSKDANENCGFEEQEEGVGIGTLGVGEEGVEVM